ncbi:XFP N-terminal domain-containing protein [Diaporthe sp. PMI_573]|nr:XFP N-terminal domain-containing protein [Diaporthaceae sp. PMI_573]
MPSEIIKQPNPPALPSQLPDDLLDLASSSRGNLSTRTWPTMIFLRDNELLESELTFDHVKPRLLGHWGTCPGLILVWSHLNLLIRNHNLDMIYVIGPGHGAPAALASLWLEGSLEKFYPGRYDLDRQGLRRLISEFSLPGGFPSHINSESPGSIHEGGELGYALAVAYGAVMDSPDLIVTAIIGDGEAESGPTAGAWHAIKYIDPAESGAVIPILHVNGFKISERTIFGCMDDKEIVSLFTGYGYQVCIVDDLLSIDEQLSNALEWALSEIKRIQKAARSGNPIIKPRWPMLVLRTPKGWGGPKKVDGQIVEGSFKSHQVPLAKAKLDESHLLELKHWLKHYNIQKLITGEGKPSESILRAIPQNDGKKIGQLKAIYDPLTPIDLPDWKPYAVKPGTQASEMKVAGDFLKRVIELNPSTFRIFSPDELESNKLGAVLQDTSRNFQWDDEARARGGRVIEILSEHACQGFMQGYPLTGRHALFPSYESFLGIVHTMMVQYAKFNKIAQHVDWRGDLASINYIETSTWAPEAARVYLPPDANCFLSTIHHCLGSRNYVNLVIGSKQPTAAYLTPEQAAEHCRVGASIWSFASTPLPDDKTQPDVVLVGIGAEVTFEVVKAAELLRSLAPALRVRVVNVTDVMVLAAESRHPHALSRQQFLDMFTADQHVAFSYHGYAAELQGLVFGRPGLSRMSVNGYREEGSTTAPFDMMLVNGLSRFDVIRRALRSGAEVNPEIRQSLDKTLRQVDDKLREVKSFIEENGEGGEEMSFFDCTLE